MNKSFQLDRRRSVHIMTCSLDEVPYLSEVSHQVIDVRRLDDPESRQLRQHPGCHPGILSCVVSHRLFASKLQEMLDCMLRFDGNIMVTVHCSAGKHRCVAFALAARHVLKQKGTSCTIDNRGTWQVGRGCLDGHCKECDASNHSDSLATALKVWRSF